MSGPDDRLLQRLAEALAAPVEEPEEADLSRLRGALSRWRRIAAMADPMSPGLTAPPRRPLRAGADQREATPPVLPPIIFRPPRTSGS